MTDPYARARRGIRSASPVGEGMGRTHDRSGHRGRISRALHGEDRHWSRKRHNLLEVSLVPPPIMSISAGRHILLSSICLMSYINLHADGLVLQKCMGNYLNLNHQG